MLSFILAAASIWYLIYLNSYIKKGTLPKWMEDGLYNARYLKERPNDNKIGQFRVVFPVLLIFVAAILAIYPLAWVFTTVAQPRDKFLNFLTPWQYFGQNPLLWGSAIALNIYIILKFRTVMRARTHHYTVDVVDKEKKDELREAHGVKGWAQRPELEAAFRNGLGGINATGSLEGLFNDKGHILTCGYARSGKGVNLISYALLDDRLDFGDAPSLVVLDPKGENLAVTGDYLKRVGYKVIVLNPFDIPEIRRFGDSRFNPFELFDADSRDFNKYVDMIRYAILPPDPVKHQNSYFSDAASELIALYISHLMTQDKEPKTIKTLYRWLRFAGDDRAALLRDMAMNPMFDIADEAKAIMQQILEGGKSITDVYSNATVATGIFKDENIRRSMETSDFSISDIPKKRTAIFICMNPQDLQRMAAWCRLVIGSMMRGFTRHYNPDRKIVMLMDEFVTMGRLTEFEEGMGYLAGYNITLWPIIQDLNQLKALYPSTWETFVGNAAIKHWMVRDNFTAEYVSKRMPMDLVFLGNNPDKTPKYKEKPLLTPVEVMNFKDIIMEVDKIGKPVWLGKRPYFDIIPKEKYSRNPFHFA